MKLGLTNLRTIKNKSKRLRIKSSSKLMNYLTKSFQIMKGQSPIKI
jgi:hypothetical protein